MTPTINVNLNPCTCKAATPYGNAATGTCTGSCPGAAVLIPLSLQFFRSITFEVALGECSETCRQYMPNGQHTANCPGRPVRVSCSISGKTWEESEPFDFGDADGHRFVTDTGVERVRERWALVKALVLGAKWGTCPRDVDEIAKRHLNLVATLFNQRDALYAELTDLALDEQSAFGSQERAVKAMGEATFMPDNFHRAEPIARASASILARYVERLIEQVGVLS
jgi:hypothetical protein